MILSLKKIPLVLTLVMICGYAKSQTQYTHPQTKDVRHAAKKEKPTLTNKVNDTVVIKDDKLGVIKIDMNSFKTQSIQITTKFLDYIKDMVNPKTSADLADFNIEQACKLFTDDARIQVSNVNNKKDPIHTYKISTYLNNLRLSTKRYDKIEIQFTDIVCVPKSDKDGGPFYSNVSYLQRFRGSNKVSNGKDSLIYGDFTRKNAKVVVSNYTDYDNGKSSTKWRIFIANIVVVEKSTKIVDVPPVKK